MTNPDAVPVHCEECGYETRMNYPCPGIAPAPTQPMSATGFHVTFVEGKPCDDPACDLKHFDVVPLGKLGGGGGR